MQHAEEASFLWLLRHAAVTRPHYSLADLSKLDNRVEAHLNGLRIAGEAVGMSCKNPSLLTSLPICSRRRQLRLNPAIGIG